MLVVRANAKLLGELKQLAEEAVVQAEERSLLEGELAQGSSLVSLKSLQCLVRHRPSLNLHELMRGCSVTSSSAAARGTEEEMSKSKKKKLEERRAFLLCQQETREYNRMVYGSARLPSDNEETISNAIQSVKYQMAISSNVLAAMAGAFGVCYYSAQKFMNFSKNKCLTAGLVGAISILLIEMLLYIIRALKMEKIQSTETKKTDSKMKITT